MTTEPDATLPEQMPEGWRPPPGLGWEIVPRKLWPDAYRLLRTGSNGSVEWRESVRKIKDWKREHDRDVRRRKVKARRKTAKLSRRRNRR